MTVDRESHGWKGNNISPHCRVVFAFAEIRTLMFYFCATFQVYKRLQTSSNLPKTIGQGVVSSSFRWTALGGKTIFASLWKYIDINSIFRDIMWFIVSKAFLLIKLNPLFADWWFYCSRFFLSFLNKQSQYHWSGSRWKGKLDHKDKELCSRLVRFLCILTRVWVRQALDDLPAG